RSRRRGGLLRGPLRCSVRARPGVAGARGAAPAPAWAAKQPPSPPAHWRAPGGPPRAALPAPPAAPPLAAPVASAPRGRAGRRRGILAGLGGRFRGLQRWRRLFPSGLDEPGCEAHLGYLDLALFRAFKGRFLRWPEVDAFLEGLGVLERLEQVVLDDLVSCRR